MNPDAPEPDLRETTVAAEAPERREPPGHTRKRRDPRQQPDVAGRLTAMAIPQRVSMVTLAVADLAVSAAFYERLGWTRSAASNEHIVWFATCDSVLGLYPRPALAADANLPAEPQARFGGVTLSVNVASEVEVDAALADAVAAGATLLRPAGRADWGGHRGYFADPDGHAWEVAFNPFVSFRDDGSLDMA